MTLNFFNMIIHETNLVSAIARRFILEYSLNMANLIGWFMIKKIYHHCIIRNLCDPIALCISYGICLHVLTHTNILKSKIESVQCTWSPKDVRILALDNSTRTLACLSAIGDDLDDILRSDLFDVVVINADTTREKH